MTKAKRHAPSKHHIIRYVLSISICTFLFVFYYNGFSDLVVNPKDNGSQIKIACVGDSITYGFGIKNQPSNSYPRLLGNMLGSECTVSNFGNIRVTVQPDGDQPYISTKTYEKSIRYNADVLIFMMGSNDAKICNWKNEKKFIEDYNTLLDSYLTGDEPPVVFLCTPASALYPDGKTDCASTYGIQPDIVDSIAETIRNIAKERGCPVIDINKSTKGHREYYSSDLIHLNALGAKVIADEVYASLINYSNNQYT